ncbi:hypothetical protein AS156_28520 [Bradyrhizobium macuxiense]|uniref:Uncharacterized protein n=1 Tax=Bradyrhizobium macuxiense TaxID=1755647 RepID=A0A120FRV4_9BRAD|nr:hypothetical protein [Bradyrhizobium macuxiense]KWV60649.1 hypothetical protein AS156_28520 [Bradyrhizobium macuxiense]
MKNVTVAAVVLALIATPALAQGRRGGGGQDKQTEKKPQIDEKAYKSALDRIPEPKEKYDPWGMTKPADPTKKPK